MSFLCRFQFAQFILPYLYVSQDKRTPMPESAHRCHEPMECGKLRLQEETGGRFVHRARFLEHGQIAFEHTGLSVRGRTLSYNKIRQSLLQF